MLDQARTLAHALGPLLSHAAAVGFRHRDVLGAVDLPPSGLFREANSLERAALAGAGRTGVALAQDAVDGRRFALRAQDLPAGTDRDIGAWDVVELRAAERL